MSTSSLIKPALAGSRVLLVGLEPWGAAAAADLAAAGVGALHLLDDRPVTTDDLAAVRFFTDGDHGRDRAGAVRARISAIAPDCAVSVGAPSVAVDRSLHLDDGRWDLVLTCLPGDDLRTAYAVARFAEMLAVPSIGAHLDGLDAVIGPVVVPGETPCWECCRLRRLANSDDPAVEHALQAALLDERPPARAHTYLPSMPALLGHDLALVAVEVLAGPGPHRLAGRLLVRSLLTLETELHTVLRMPHCSICGGAFVAGAAPPGGNGRNMSEAEDPEELRRLLAGVVDHRTGIVRRLLVRPAAATEPELPIAATALLGRYTEGTVRHCPGAEMGSGKGTTNLRAMVSAVGEAVERYSAGRFHYPALIRAAVAEMEGDFLAPADLCPYAEAQYDEPDFPFMRLSPHTPIDWVRGYWLDTRAPVLVPALPAYMGYHPPPDEAFVEVTSNGLAAGPTLDAAALSAALELCERDAFMVSWLARLPGQRVILDASVAADAREAARQIEEQGVQVELYLLDSGLGIPTIACVGYGDGERWPGATVSLAAHVHPRKAIARALFEQGHLGPYLCRLVADGRRAIPERPEDVDTLEDHALYYVPKRRSPALAFLGAGGEIAAADLPVPDGAPVDVLVRRIAAAGLRIAIVDVTSPDLAETPIRVARALGAGFQQIHFGHRLVRRGNPRLLAMVPHGVNPAPHPMA